MRIVWYLALTASLLFANKQCDEKRERLKELEMQQDAEQAGEVLSWLTLTRPTSSRKKQLDQQVRLLRLEVQQCDLAASQED